MDSIRNTLFPGAGGSDSASADGVPWWMKYLAKAVAILAALGKIKNLLTICDYELHLSCFHSYPRLKLTFTIFAKKIQK